MDKNKIKEVEVSTTSNNGQSTPNSFASLSFFRNSEGCLYVHKKTERLVSALYLLSGLMSDTELLKTKFRVKGLDLLSQSLVLAINSRTSIAKPTDEFTATILEIISLLEIAQISHLISSMNYDVIVAEFKALLPVVEGKCSGHNSSSLTSDFFAIHEQLSPSVIPVKTGIQGIGYDNNLSKNKLSNSTSIKDTNGQNVLNNLSKTKPVKTTEKTNRSEQILSLMKKDKLMTIKDFASVIKDCSEKTLQRELLSLVAKGLAKKEGERRWSRYSLV